MHKGFHAVSLPYICKMHLLVLSPFPVPPLQAPHSGLGVGAGGAAPPPGESLKGKSS